MTEGKELPINSKRTGAHVVFDALKKAGVIKSEDNLTPEMLELMKETNEGVDLLKGGKSRENAKNIPTPTPPRPRRHR